ncbi:hypothetical protein HETIRDRAFT_416350 [Heterobasidion irregulare TC 32-1]|uniref:Uncharacterized protein n=1 Tax=Heterobasidion irregulare (strain TC 32-1) TaxID=747525 RepID=W4KFR2_HETIT|nr:uncharacterized protein HETIRDRAFT_416350 [Heterobasidion irregulare TC 32-1]ETW84683.1 hypothetical protein HETIRDRAFT_416350 [Heterobasidion irregulare TC 32-1]
MISSKANTLRCIMACAGLAAYPEAQDLGMCFVTPHVSHRGMSLTPRHRGALTAVVIHKPGVGPHIENTAYLNSIIQPQHKNWQAHDEWSTCDAEVVR